MLFYRFNFDDGSTSIVSVKSNVVQRELKVLNITNLTSILDKVVFKNIYYGNIDVQKVILFNDSPVSSHFAVVFDQEKSYCIHDQGSVAIAMTDHHNTHQIKNLEHIFQVNPDHVCWIKSIVIRLYIDYYI